MGFHGYWKTMKPTITGPKDKQLMDWLWYNQYPGSYLVALCNSIQQKKVNLHYRPTKQGYTENSYVLTWL